MQDTFQVRYKITDLISFAIPFSIFTVICVVMFFKCKYTMLNIFFATYLFFMALIMVIPTILFFVKIEGEIINVRTRIGRKYEFNVSDIEKIICEKRNGPRLGPSFSIRLMTSDKEVEMDMKMINFDKISYYLLYELSNGKIKNNAISKHCKNELIKYKDESYKNCKKK